MRTIWTIICVIAVANLLALAGFTLWLRGTDRLSMERVAEIRGLVSKTLTERGAEIAAASAAEERAKAAAEALAKADRPPLTAAERLAARMEATELDRQKAERLRREVEDLQRRLSQERSEIDRARAGLVADQATFEQAVAVGRDAIEEEQFRKTLGVLESLKPAAAMAMLLEMIDGPVLAAGADPANAVDEAGAVPPPVRGRAGENGTETVVRYLDKMDDRPRTKLMAEIVKKDPALAAELLEGLRRRGEFARTPEPADR